MKKILLFIGFLLISSSDISARAHICPMFDYIRNIPKMNAGKAAALPTSVSATIRFSHPPNESRVAELETRGLEFQRHEGRILHTRNIWMVNWRKRYRRPGRAGFAE